MTGTLTDYQIISRTYGKQAERLSQRGDVQRDIETWRETITSVKSVDEFVDNSRLYRFAMRAFGLEDQIFARGLIRKVLEEGTDDPEAMANRLTDRRFREFADAFRFPENGTPTTADPAAMEQVVNRFVVLELERTAGEDNPGVRLALYFERRAPEINNWFDVLADKALSEVVRTVLRLPTQVAGLDIDRYAALLEERLDIEDFKDPEKLSDFVRRFTVLHDLDQGILSSAAGQRAALIQPLGNRPPVFGLSPDILLNLAALRRG